MNRALVLLVIAILVLQGGAQSVNLKGMMTANAPFQYVSIADNPALVPSNAMTMEAWFYLAGTAQPDPTILRKSVDFPSTSWLMRIEDAGTTLKSYLTINGNAYNFFTATVPNVANAWHHMATTYDGSVARMYLDGVQVATQSITGVITFMPGDLVIGRGTGSAEQWIGSIDEVRLWSVARTAQQIQATRFVEVGPTPGLISVWRLNGNYLDSIGAHHGIPVGPIQNVLSTSPVVGAYVTAPTLAPLGSVINYQIHSSQPGTSYIFDVSITGTSPGVPLPSPSTLTIPLNPPWIHQEFGSYFPASTFTGFVGVIPPSLLETPSLDLPADPAIVGLTVSSAFVLLDPLAPLSVGFVSAPASTTVADFAPTVSDVSPDTLPVTGGAPITITGSHFQPGASVHVGGAPATYVLVVDPGLITAVCPPGAPGPAGVTVTNPDTLSAVLPAAVTYVPSLVVTSISPLIAPAGATVTVSGQGFVPGLQLFVAGSPVPATVFPTSVTFQAPAGAPCNALVSLVNPNQLSGQIGWNPAPAIYYVFNNSGSPGGGGYMFITGSFTPGTTVTIGGIPALVTFSPTALLVVAPGNPPGEHPVILTATNGCTASTTYLYL